MKNKILIPAGITVVILCLVFLFIGSHSKKNTIENSEKTAVVIEPPEAAALFTEGKEYLAKGDLLNARAAYQKIIAGYPNATFIEEAQKTLWDLNVKLLFSPVMTGDGVSYQVEPGDNLWKIAKKFSTTVELLKRANNLTGDKLKAGMKLKVTKAKFSVLVDKSQNTLALKKGEEIIKLYRVSTGANNSTPVGTFKIVNKLENPPWYKTGAVVPPGSPENILGTRWLGIDRPSYGIHGTTDPASIGKQVTAGCVRMTNADVEELYAILPSGSEATIVD